MATLAAGLAVALAAIVPAGTTTQQRSAAATLHQGLAAILDPLARCAETDGCAHCRLGGSCAVDTWRRSLTHHALGGEPAKTAEKLLDTTGREAGTGGHLVMRKRDERLAEMALRVARRHWLDLGQTMRADLVADLAWEAGCRDPEIAEAQAVAVASGGREADLAAALAIGHEGIVRRAGATEVVWGSLETRRALLDGRRECRRRPKSSDA